jgi:hypothetical protein
VKSVKPLPDLVLSVVFVSGETKLYDVKPLMAKHEVFKDLTQNKLFDLVRVDAGGFGIAWNDYIDLACNELWEKGIEA